MEHRVTYLWNRWIDRSISPEESQELMRLLEQEVEEESLGEMLLEGWQVYESLQPPVFSDQEKQVMLQHILPHRAKLISHPMVRVAVAAVLIVALGLGAYFAFFRQASPPSLAQQSFNRDITAPNSTKAVITLSSGQQIVLDSAGGGTLASQGKIKLIKTAEGQIAYKGTSEQLFYNTLTNPRGSKVVSLTLADGTKVWLNAASSLTYPVAFVGTERRVQLSGEAYFEVAQQEISGTGTKKPFKVALLSTPSGESRGEVAVLGTHFNVNAYSDEPAIKVTLLEGSVHVSNKAGAVTIKPGEQARVTINQKPETTSSVDLEQVMAWKNGLFSFNGADIRTVMREVARWYDVEVEYQGEVKETFYGKINRSTNVSNVFKILQTTGGVHFEMEGRKIIVKP